MYLSIYPSFRGNHTLKARFRKIEARLARLKDEGEEDRSMIIQQHKSTCLVSI